MFGSRGSEDEVDSTCLEIPCMTFPKPLGIYDTREVVQVEAPLACGPAFIHTVTSELLDECSHTPVYFPWK